MIKAQHLAFYKWFYAVYAQLTIKRAFESVNINIPNIDNDKALLVIANHHSWWDGFWVLNLNRQLWRKRFHVMMLLEQLKRHPTFRFIGAYSVQKGARSVLETLHYTSHLLKDNQNMVLLFPQGKIQSQHMEGIKFQKGINRIITSASDINVLMLVSLTDYFSNKKNGLWVYGKILNQYQNIEKSYNDFYLQCKKQQQVWKG